MGIPQHERPGGISYAHDSGTIAEKAIRRVVIGVAEKHFSDNRNGMTNFAKKGGFLGFEKR
jgi:hypothetical protein